MKLLEDVAWILERRLPDEPERSGLEQSVVERVQALLTEHRHPLVPAGSEDFMSRFIGELVDDSDEPLKDRIYSRLHRLSPTGDRKAVAAKIGCSLRTVTVGAKVYGVTMADKRRQLPPISEMLVALRSGVLRDVPHSGLW